MFSFFLQERFNSNSANLPTTPQRLKPVQLLDNNSTITSQVMISHDVASVSHDPCYPIQAYQLASVVSHMGGSNAGELLVYSVSVQLITRQMVFFCKTAYQILFKFIVIEQTAIADVPRG